MRWTRGRMAFVAVLGLAVVGAVLAPMRAWTAQQPTKITVTMTNYKFAPDKLTFKVGQRVELTLINQIRGQDP